MLLSVPGKVLNRVILDRLKTGVDAKLRDHQAGFRKDRSCTDQIATLRIIVEQSIEWDSSLYINFVDYDKAFDSLDRDTLWKLLQHYGIPNKLISLIRNSYEDMACRVIHAGQLTDSFMVKTGVRQGCLLSPFLFLLAIDWIMKKTTKYRRNGIQWTPWSQLEDLDFADDLALLSHSHQQMQGKNRATKHSVNTARTQHQQKQDKDYESQHKEQQPHYNERRATGRDRLIHIPGQYNQQTWRHSRRRQSKDTESKSCIHHVEKNLESKTN